MRNVWQAIENEEDLSEFNTATDQTWITTDAALAVMAEAMYRLIVHDKDSDAWKMGWTEPEIYHEGKWKSLCRTDLKDDVATGWSTVKTLEEWREFYTRGLKKYRMGVRYNDRRFSIIDAFSDG